MVTMKRLAKDVYFVWPDNDRLILMVDAQPVAMQDFKTNTFELLATADYRDRYYTRKYITRLGGTLVNRIACPVILHREG